MRICDLLNNKRMIDGKDLQLFLVGKTTIDRPDKTEKQMKFLSFRDVMSFVASEEYGEMMPLTLL